MGSHHRQVAILVPDEKLNCFYFSRANFFQNKNEIAFIRGQWSHLADDGSPLPSYCEIVLKQFISGSKKGNFPEHFLRRETGPALR